jgi:hypothetical protein
MNLFRRQNEDKIEKNDRSKVSVTTVQDAIDVLKAQQLYIYNILSEQDLTSPSGFPLKVERKTNQGFPTVWICISLLNDKSYDLFFFTDGTEGRDEILRKAKMLTSVGWRKKEHVLACCPYGEVDGKVCHCELHGTNPLVVR